VVCVHACVRVCMCVRTRACLLLCLLDNGKERVACTRSIVIHYEVGTILS
jgi:hypothetical protein